MDAIEVFTGLRECQTVKQATFNEYAVKPVDAGAELTRWGVRRKS